MKLSFDYYHNLEDVELYLCNPDGRELFPLPGRNRHIKLRFNDLSELTFDVDSQATLSNNTVVDLEAYEYIQTKRLIFATNIGWFQITGVNENDNGVAKYKSVTTESYQSVLKNKGFISEERVYCFYNPDDPLDDRYDSTKDDCIPSVIGQWSQQLGIHLALEQGLTEPDEPFTDWTVTYVPQRLVYSGSGSVCRTFKEDTTYGYDWMVNDVEKAFGVVVLFDFMYKTIRVMMPDEVTEKVNVIYTFNNFIKNIEVTEDSKDIVTVLNCNGNNCDITEVNPTGTNYICDFSYYMDKVKHRWMSDALIDKLEAWEAACASQKDTYTNYVSQLRELYRQQTERKTKLQSMSLAITDLRNAQSRRDILSTNNSARILAKARSSSDPLIKEYVNDYELMYEEYRECAESAGISLHQTVFGNIDTDNRLLLMWTPSNKAKYRNEIVSWGIDENSLRDYSTVLGRCDSFGGVDIAYSPILQTDAGAVLLSAQTVQAYFDFILNMMPHTWTTEELLSKDLNGANIGGIHISSLIADVADNAMAISIVMHYAGSTGALANIINDIAAELGEEEAGGVLCGTICAESVENTKFWSKDENGFVEVGGQSLKSDSRYYSTPFTGDALIAAHQFAPEYNATSKKWEWLNSGMSTIATANSIITHNLSGGNSTEMSYWYFSDDGDSSYCKLRGATVVDKETGESVNYCGGFDRYIAYTYPIVDNATGKTRYTDTLQDWIDLRESIVTNLNLTNSSFESRIFTLMTSIREITDRLNIQSYFSDTPGLLKELGCYWIEGEYTNDNIAVLDNTTPSERIDLSNELLASGYVELSKVCKPRLSFSVESVDATKNYEFRNQMRLLELGKIVTIEKEEGVWYYPALLEISMNLDYADEFDMVFANAMRLDDWGYTYADLISEAASTSRQVSANWQDILAYAKERETISRIIKDPFDMTLKASFANMVNQDFIVDKTGILGRKRLPDSADEYENEQIRIINNSLIFTDDNWQTAKTALGKISYDDGEGNTVISYGLIADTIIGSLIMSEKLKIVNDSNTIILDNDGISIRKYVVDDNTGNISVDTSGNPIFEETFHATSDGDLILRGKIFGGEININDNFVVDTNGNVRLNGNITWGAGASPTQVLYARTAIPKPSDNSGWESFPSGYPTGWHKTYSETYDYYATYTYDGGSTWCAPVQIRGMNGTGAPVDYLSVFNLLTNNGTTRGCFTAQNGELYINADYIRGGRIDAGLILAGHVEACNIEATGGTIGGWTISGSSIYKEINSNNYCGLSSFAGDGDTHYIYTKQSLITPEVNGNPYYSSVRFYAGAPKYEATGDIYTGNAKFAVLNDGSLYASAAHIEGSISNVSGNFGVRIVDNRIEFVAVGETIPIIPSTGLYKADARTTANGVQVEGVLYVSNDLVLTQSLGMNTGAQIYISGTPCLSGYIKYQKSLTSVGYLKFINGLLIGVSDNKGNDYDLLN